VPGVGEGRVEGRDVGGLRDEGEGLGQEAVRRGEIVGRRHTPPLHVLPLGMACAESR